MIGDGRITKAMKEAEVIQEKAITTTVNIGAKAVRLVLSKTKRRVTNVFYILVTCARTGDEPTDGTQWVFAFLIGLVSRVPTRGMLS